MQLSAEFVNNLVAVLNVLASQVATALDTLNFALMTERSHPSDTRMSPRHHGTPGTGCALASSQSAFRLTDPALLEPDLWTLHPPGIYRPYPHLVRPIWMPMLDHLPPPRPLAPLAPHGGREPGQMTPTTPDSDSDGSVRPHPGASSFRPSPTVVRGPRELLQEFTIALRNAHHEPFTAWTQSAG